MEMVEVEVLVEMEMVVAVVVVAAAGLRHASFCRSSPNGIIRPQ